MATVNDYKTARNYNAEALGGDDATLDNLSGVSSVIVQAPLGHGVAQFYAEGDAATYAPSNEPMGVSSPQMNPTNSEPTLFCAEHGADGCGCMKMDAESKSMFTKGTKGKMFARKRNGRIITHNAEGDSAIYAPSNEPQSSSPQTNPTNSEPNLFGAESKAMFTKDKRGKMYARRRNGRIITRNAEFVPNGDGRITGQQDFVYNGTPFHSESYEADYALEKPFVTGAKLSAGLLTGAAMFGIAGMAITALFGEMLNRGE